MSERDIRDYVNIDKDLKELVEAAIQVRKKAYCPYSNFPVGSAVRTESGEIFTGCNIENAAHGPSICAERVAISKAISEGHRRFSAIAVVAYQEKDYTSPCGVCRQVLSEFAEKDIPVYIAKPSPATVYVTSIYKLLPDRFISDTLRSNLNFTT